jgi:hypothetical protein
MSSINGRSRARRMVVGIGASAALVATAVVVSLSTASASPVAHEAKAAAPSIITGITVEGYPLPKEPTITVTGSGFGVAPTKGVSPNKLENCGTGNTGTDYGPSAIWANNASTQDGLYGTTRWGGYVTKKWGDCSGVNIVSWDTTQVVFTVGSRYARDGVSMESGDTVCAMIKGGLGCLTLP